MLILGAGLAAALIAVRLAREAEPPRVVMVESATKPFGRHTWSFHASDVDARTLRWLGPMARVRWPCQEVRFPGMRRVLRSEYLSLTSETVGAAVARLTNVTIRTGVTVEAVSPGGVVLADGTRLRTGLVIDARGFRPNPGLVVGFQKFLGLEIETTLPHGLAHPILMDATVPQEDGYRFLYCLPFSATRMLVEDTRYADGAELDEPRLERAIMDYAAGQGWHIAGIRGRERGVLPIALAHDFRRFSEDLPEDVPVVGMRAGLFHPTTGYSLPEAARTADLVARHWREGGAALAARLRAYAEDRHRAQGFYRLLNRMLFRAARPERRYLVLQRFYRLPRPLIERFYAGASTWGDVGRILIGKPPVPLGRAMACLSERALLRGAA